MLNLQRELQDIGGKCWPQSLKVREIQLAALTLESQVPFTLLPDKRDELHMIMRDLLDDGSICGQDTTDERHAADSALSTRSGNTASKSSAEIVSSADNDNVKQESVAEEMSASSKNTSHASGNEDISSFADSSSVLLSLPAPLDEEQITENWKMLEEVLIKASRPGEIRVEP